MVCCLAISWVVRAVRASRGVVLAVQPSEGAFAHHTALKYCFKVPCDADRCRVEARDGVEAWRRGAM